MIAVKVKKQNTSAIKSTRTAVSAIRLRSALQLQATQDLENLQLRTPC